MARQPQYRSWCFTVNNYSEEELNSFKEVDCKYIIIGKEKGKEGTPHLQGYAQFKTPKNLNQCKNINARAHWEQAKGNPQQNKDYCSKEGDFFEKGILPKNGKRSLSERAEINKMLWTMTTAEAVEEGHISIMNAVQLENARNLLNLSKKVKNTRGIKGIWIWGPPNTGKTHWAREHFPNYYEKKQTSYWGGYKGEENIICEDWNKPLEGEKDYTTKKFKNWADRWSTTGEIKHGPECKLQHQWLVVTSNYHPDDFYKDDYMAQQAVKRRFSIFYKKEQRSDPEPEDPDQYNKDCKPFNHWEEEEEEKQEEEEKKEEQHEVVPGDSYAPE